MQDVLDRAKLAGALLVRDVVEAALDAVDQLLNVPRVGVDVVLGGARGVEQLPQQGMLLDDPGVVADVAGRRDHARQRVDVGRAPGLLELTGAAELVTDRDRVYCLRVGLLLQPAHGAEDLLVPRPVEVLGPQPGIDQDAVESLLGQQDRAQDRGLGL